MSTRLLLIFVPILSIFSCQQSSHHQNNTASKSTLLHFEYGGYSDTIFAVVDGKILTQDTLKSDKVAMIPLADVTVIAEQNKKSVHTDKDGNFSIGLEKGTFSFIVSKSGYQSLRIFNYISKPDQVANAQIVLVKGSSIEEVRIPDKR